MLQTATFWDIVKTSLPDGNKFKTEYQTMGSRRPKSGAVTKLLSFGVKQ